MASALVQYGLKTIPNCRQEPLNSGKWLGRILAHFPDADQRARSTEQHSTCLAGNHGLVSLQYADMTSFNYACLSV